jgi:zinc transport system permease protein
MGMIIERFLLIFSFSFMIRALLVGLLTAVSSSMVGTFLVLKRYSMIGHGLSHVAFGAVAVGLLFSTSPLLIALPLVVMTSVIILKLNEKADVHADAAIGVMATTAMALGTLLASIDGGFTTVLNTYLFGSILTVQWLDFGLALALLFGVIGFVGYNYHSLFSLTYDPTFAHVSGIPVKRLNLILAIFTGIIVVVGIRLLGTILISSFIIFPTLISMQFKKGFKTTFITSLIIALSTVFFGISMSFIYDFPTGSSIVLLNAVVFIFVFIVETLKRRRAS